MNVRPRSVDDLRALGAWATVEEVAAFLGKSRAQLYDDVKRGRPLPFEVVRVGRVIRIPVAPLLVKFDDVEREYRELLRREDAAG